VGVRGTSLGFFPTGLTGLGTIFVNDWFFCNDERRPLFLLRLVLFCTV
jgi:hypothetical protein